MSSQALTEKQGPPTERGWSSAPGSSLSSSSNTTAVGNRKEREWGGGTHRAEGLGCLAERALNQV